MATKEQAKRQKTVVTAGGIGSIGAGFWLGGLLGLVLLAVGAGALVHQIHKKG
jgi:hypothetical protein